MRRYKKKIRKKEIYECDKLIYKGVTCEMLYNYSRLTSKFNQCTKCNAMYGTTYNSNKHYKIKLIGKIYMNIDNILKIEVYNNG